MSIKKGGGPKQHVATYYMSIFYGICAGPVDKLHRIFVAEKEAWVGPATSKSSVTISNPELFGGLKQEGGVSGVMDFLPGASDQTMPSRLAGRFPAPSTSPSPLTEDTCPGFRGITSLFFTDGGTGGFYWSANSPYIRGVWAEVERIFYDWYPAKAAIYRADEDSGNTSFIAINGATGNTAQKWDTNGNYAVRGEQTDDNIQVWSLPSGTLREIDNPGVVGIHVTNSGEIFIRDFSPGTFHIYDGSTGAEIKQIEVSITLNLNFGTLFDEIAESISAFSLPTLLSGIAHLLAWSKNGFSEQQFVLFKRNGFEWVLEQTVSTTISNIKSLSLGDPYAYCMLGSTPTQIVRVNWRDLDNEPNGDTITPTGLTDTIAACHYDKQSDQVVIACINGDIFSYSADLSTLIDSSTGNEFTLFAADGLLSKRMTIAPGRLAFHNVGATHLNNIYEFSIPGLSPIRTIDVSTTTLPGKDQNSGTNGFDFQGFNEKWSAAFLPSHFGKTVVWFFGAVTKPDMNPAHIILEVLTNTAWGMGAPLSSLDLDSFTSAADTLYSEGFGLSMMWAEQSEIEVFVREVLDHIEANLFVNPRTGLLTLKLIRDDYDPDALPEFNEDNCVITDFQRKSWGDTINQIVVSWTDPDNEKQQTVTRIDDGNVAIQGGIVSDSRNYYGVRTQTLAATLADRDLRVSSYPLAIASIEADRSAWDLVPGDVIKLSYTEYGIASIVMRVVSIDYGKPGDSKIKLSLAEDVFALDVAQFVSPPPRLWNPPGEDPTEAAFSLPFTLPYMLAIATQVITSASEYPEAVTGVLAAQDGSDTTTFELIGESSNAAGGLSISDLGTRTIVAHATLVDAISAEVETAITSSGLSGLTQGEGPVEGGMALIGSGDDSDNELVLITEVVSGIYTLQRGILDTIPRAWPAGTAIWFFSSNTKLHDPRIRSASETALYKVLPRTSTGLLPEGDAPLLSLTVGERPHLPSRPANVKVNGTAFSGVNLVGSSPPIEEFDVTWANRNRVTEDSQPLAWDDAGVTPEAGQTTKIEILDSLTRAILVTFSGLTGESYTVPISAFSGGSPDAVTAIVRVTAEIGDSPTFESLQGFEIPIQVDPGASTLEITGTPVLTGQVGIAYAGFVVTASGGVPPYSFSLQGTWPSGLSISAGPSSDQATISGTPTESGSFTNAIVRVTDSFSETADLTINSPALEITEEDTTAPVLSNPTGTGQ